MAGHWQYELAEFALIEVLINILFPCIMSRYLSRYLVDEFLNTKLEIGNQNWIIVAIAAIRCSYYWYSLLINDI